MPAIDPGPDAPPSAAYFELYGRTFPLDANGQLVDVHPVDQSVALVLGIRLGGLAAARNVGIDIARLKNTPRAAMQDTVNDIVAAALGPLIQAGDVQLLGSPLMPDAAGRPWFFVDYVNLRLPAPAGQRRVPVK